MPTAAEATAAIVALAHAAGGDPFGVRTVSGAQAAFVRGAIELHELERRLELILAGKPCHRLGEFPEREPLTCDRIGAHISTWGSESCAWCGEPLYD